NDGANPRDFCAARQRARIDGAGTGQSLRRSLDGQSEVQRAFHRVGIEESGKLAAQGRTLRQHRPGVKRRDSSASRPVGRGDSCNANSTKPESILAVQFLPRSSLNGNVSSTEAWESDFAGHRALREPVV